MSALTPTSSSVSGVTAFNCSTRALASVTIPQWILGFNETIGIKICIWGVIKSENSSHHFDHHEQPDNRPYPVENHDLCAMNIVTCFDVE